MSESVERREAGTFVLQVESTDRNVEVSVFEDLEKAKHRVRSVMDDSSVWRAFVTSSKNPNRVLCYYFSGDGQFYDLDKRKPQRDFSPKALPS